MSSREDFLFWRLAHYFIIEKNYSLLQISERHDELWLENTSKKDAQVIRLLRYDLDWGNKLQRDIQHTAVRAENVRKHLMKRELTVLNLYISEYTPVDEYESYIRHPLQVNKKTTVHSVIIDKEVNSFGSIINIPSAIQLKDEYDDQEILAIKSAALNKAVESSQQEQQFFNNGKPFFTYAFLVIQIIMFILLEITGGSTNIENLIKYGAKYNPAIMEGEWWRFITPIFLHIGLSHVIMNSIAIYFLGTIVERVYGRIRFILIYLFSGFAGVLASFIFSDQISAGASGAIYGCFGALLFIGATNPKIFFRTMGTNVIVVLILNLVISFTVPVIDLSAHIGGLLGGFLASAIVFFPKKRKVLLQIGAFILTMIITAVSLYFGYHNETATSINSWAQHEIQKGQNYEKIYERLSNFEKTGKGDALTYFQLSYTELQLNKTEDAKKHLLKTIQLKPDFHEAHFNLALIYYQDDRNITKAKQHLKEAIRISDDKKYKEYLEQLNQLED
ncbi:rhomboid family intramembrane serine protease [Heyndrickxia oleronia]|uniref:rhomboid family intramembrane serine protease n=1 Tax=Heyndrickxia oleronia TaxID=38875 RepID=UPI000716FBA5|nr:rhomboid family intramembrane serine protease [Heyndrickxia oleronia]NYV64586.1 rhomboid family intramembrane serine protease [Bacillus sp. Gen3]MBU5213420.1 rhomboid family intramembrane serine protease [Heyndrickxia oleronia]MCI1593638.1 rhomboid family intramembrane serine protease [Heyndrickxia oleronia]MCI1615832.1 rhomboid family intramembrane serine protease [Heyndrickxia oleronia]MCI1746429.1 rhomboid family intramembrane serine protease [Heyndrickxia oleronia]